MFVALVIHHENISGHASSRMTAHIVDDPSPVGQAVLLNELATKSGSAMAALEVERVVTLEGLPGFQNKVSRILTARPSVFRAYINAQLTKIVSAAYRRGEVIGLNEAVMER